MKTPHAIALAAAVVALAIPFNPVAAQSCDSPPLFDMSGPDCSAVRQGKECACSECFQWNASQDATWYEILRCDRPGGNCTIVGNTRSKNRAAYTDWLGRYHPRFQPTIWCAAWDNPFPRIHRAYDYTVRACTAGASGPMCSAQFSNAVGYTAAPYMCIDHGVEVACRSSNAPVSGLASDLDADGTIDVQDGDDDDDGIADAKDNCPLTVNVGQRDGDHDGVGDACDLDPNTPGSLLPDADHDGVGDGTDLCPWTYDPAQKDADADRLGDACDNCPNTSNVTQTDSDADGQGDVCDVDDAMILAVWGTRTRLTWAPEAGYATWCVYRGDLKELKLSRTYSQLPGSNPIAARTCALTTGQLDDTFQPAVGTTAFYLVAGRPDSTQLELGVDGSGLPRPNANPCP